MYELSNFEPEQKATLYLTVAMRHFLSYLQYSRGPIRIDLAYVSDSGIYFYSMSDNALKELWKAGQTVLEDTVEVGGYAFQPTYNEIKGLFERQIEDPKYRHYFLLCEPKNIGRFDEHTKVYAAAIGYKGSIHTELFEILFSRFLAKMREAVNRESMAKMKEIRFQDEDGVWYTLSRESITTFLAKKIYDDPSDERRNELYETLCLVSSAAYEKAPNHGKIGLLTKGTEGQSAYIRFSTPVDIDREHVRQIRKLLEMSNAYRNRLMVEDGKITGIFTPKESYNNTEIAFRGNGKWDFVVQKRPLLSFESVCIKLGSAVSDHELQDRITSTFGGKCDLERLKSIINEAKKQPHGTTIIITDKASIESNRLSAGNRATKIEPILAERDAVRSITAIDGAVLLAPDGKCYAIGAILDGVSGEHGDLSRGARYNSAITYVDYWSAEGYKIIAVIVSADESIDIYPKV